VTDQDGLEGPSQKVTPGKDVQMTFYAIPTDVRAINAIFLGSKKTMVDINSSSTDRHFLTFSISMWKFFNFGSIQ